MLKSGIVSVDLEGNLRQAENGCITMIQICNPFAKEVYLLDYLLLQRQADVQISNSFISRVMMHEEIVKIFHDCRHDSEALHFLLRDGLGANVGTCLSKVFDTSACEVFIKKLLGEPNSDRLPGLNELLEKYEATINQHKSKYHEIWSGKKEESSNTNKEGYK